MVSSRDLDVAYDQTGLVEGAGLIGDGGAPRTEPLLSESVDNQKTTTQNQKVFDSHLLLLYKGSGTSIVLGNPEQGSDRFKGNTGAGQVCCRTGSTINNYPETDAGNEHSLACPKP